MIDELAIAGSGVWTANRAVYCPVCVQQPITVTDAITTVVTQNGNLDVGIYDWAGVRLVSSGSTAVGTALTVQTIALADTALNRAGITSASPATPARLRSRTRLRRSARCASAATASS